MAQYLAPGVYVEEVSFRAPSIEGVGTSTAAFVGPTLTGPVGQTPELLTSFGDYQNIYGSYDNLAIDTGNVSDLKNTNYMALSVKGFFDNGGAQLYVSRVFVGKTATDAGLGTAGTVSDTDVGLTARFPGASGNQTVTVTVNAVKTQTPGGLPPGSLIAVVPAAPGAVTFYTNGNSGAFNGSGGALPSPAPANLYVLTMRVTVNGASGFPQVYDGLGFDFLHPNYLGTALALTPPRHIDALENQIAFIIGKTLTPVTLYQAIFGASANPVTGGAKVYTLAGGDDGNEPTATDYANALAWLTGLEDVAIVAAPGSGIFNDHQNIVNDLITHVSQQRAYRIAILETPPGQIASDNEGVRAQIDSSYAALYVPWVITPNPLARSGSSISSEIAVPPSGFMAGIYARNDVQNGVSKAPANEVVLGASRFERNITFNEQGLLNPLGINCLRYFPNRGYRVWGARTVSSDSEFMYVNVRRYLIYLEHSIDNSTQWAVFENNGPALWSRVKESIDSFLFNEWKEGSLLGDSASQAYFVRCDRTTMTQNDQDNGRMICLIGVALLKPAEFVIFRIGQKTADTQS